MYRNKVQPIPPVMPKEIKIQRNSSRKVIKWVVLLIFLLIVGVGTWIGFVANRAIKNITDDNQGNKSSLLSLLGNYDTNDLKGKAQGRTNILIMGMGGKNHPGGALSDTMIVMSINYADKKIGLISIPRDLWVPIPGYGSAKINEAYADGEKNKKVTGGGGALASRTVENILGIPVHYYVTVDFEGFKKLIDSVGGIDIYVDKALYDPYYPAANMIDYDPFKIGIGQHHMDGATALKYARSRETTSDFDRSRRQEQVMSALKDKLFTLGFLSNPKKITDLMNTLGDHIRTNMQVNELKAFWEVTKTLDTTNIINKVLDTSAGGPLLGTQDSRGYYIYPRKGATNFSELQTLAKNLFESNVADLTQLKIKVLNGTGKSGEASKLAKTLESYGFSNIITGNTKLSEKTQVIDCSGGQYSNEINQIITNLSIGERSKSACSSGAVNIEIIVGKDFLNR